MPYPKKHIHSFGAFCFALVLGVALALALFNRHFGSVEQLLGGRTVDQTFEQGTGSQQRGAPQVLAASGGTAGCRLSFSVTPTSLAVPQGGTITYNVTLKNNGTINCRHVSYSIYYAANESFVSATPRPSASNYYWSIGNLSVGKEFVAQVTTRNIPGESEVYNEACAAADNAEDACTNSVITVGVAPNEQPPVELPGETTPNEPAGDKEFGMWVWNSPQAMSASQVSTMLAELEDNEVNAIYVTIDDYLDIAVLPAGAAKTAKIQSYYTKLSQLVIGANARGVAVDLVGGAPDWGSPGMRWKGYALIEFVKNYNQQYPNQKVRAFQYDVEPYLMPSYESNKASVLSNYVAFIDASMSQMQLVNAGFSLAIPHFFDSTQEWTPAINFGGKTDFAFTHLVRIMSRKPDSTIHIMAYRDYFSGSNGVYELSVPELTEAAASSTRILIAQEVGDVEPDFVTFYGQPKADFLSAVQEIYSGFASYSSFAGVSVNFLDPFLVLK